MFLLEKRWAWILLRCLLFGIYWDLVLLFDGNIPAGRHRRRWPEVRVHFSLVSLRILRAKYLKIKIKLKLSTESCFIQLVPSSVADQMTLTMGRHYLISQTDCLHAHLINSQFPFVQTLNHSKQSSRVARDHAENIQLLTLSLIHIWRCRRRG